jgi:hypothetical protein
MYQLLGFLLIFISACASTHQNPSLQLIPENEYEKSVDTYTERKQLYDGFYQTLEFSATLLNTQVLRQQVDHNARIYQWDEITYNNKKSETENNLSKKTQIFLSFFVPERKHDDLSKSKTTWKIFLDAGGKRYEGKAEKMKNLLAEVVGLYPHHNRWSTPYMLTFNVPTSMVENTVSKLTLTGPVVSATVDFKEAK